jgi:hypothetical protein
MVGVTTRLIFGRSADRATISKRFWIKVSHPSAVSTSVTTAGQLRIDDMTDRRHDDSNAKVRAIIDDAIAELYLLGMESSDQAASLMAIQAIIRIDDPDVIAKVAKFATELIEPIE